MRVGPLSGDAMHLLYIEGVGSPGCFSPRWCIPLPQPGRRLHSVGVCERCVQVWGVWEVRPG